MTWAKLDDQIFYNPKMLQLEPPGKLGYLSSLAYCAGQLTDGFVPTRAIPLLVGMAGCSFDPAAIVNARLWEIVDGGYQVHDYLEYNPSREQVTAERLAAKERMKRVRSGEVRPNIDSSSSSPSPGPVPSLVPVEIQPKVAAQSAAPAQTLLKKTTRENGKPPETQPDKDLQPNRVLYAITCKKLGRKPETDSERGKWNRGIKELVAAGVTGEEYERLLDRAEREWGPGCDRNPMAIAPNLSSLRAPPKAEREAEEAAETEKRKQAAWASTMGTLRGVMGQANTEWEAEKAKVRSGQP